ncbi:MAG: cytochrome c [Chrysiogenetes bacterium]|nr:cytochrome c [Chrysiogenetes bacterium]
MNRISATFVIAAALFVAACSSPENNRPAPSPSGTAKSEPMKAEKPAMEEAAPAEAAMEEAAPAEGEAAAMGETAAAEATEEAAEATGAAFGPGSQDPAKVAAGQKIFQTRCATCHGKDGHGDGVGWSDPNKSPRNYHDIEWQKNTTDERIIRVITRGGAANGLDARMPAHADLRSNKEALEGLVAFIREMGDGKM